MRASSSSFGVSALGLMAITLAACSGFSGTEPPTPAPNRGDGPGSDGRKAPTVGGPADENELTNAFGIFVSTSGADNADGTLEHPLSQLQPAIELAKKVGKRVYVCTGVYREALVLADSISIIGGLDCSGEKWRTGGVHTRIESPTSPAVRAKDIVTETRIESLDILAPAATAPGTSSIALHADRAFALVIASSRLVAGDAARGEDGTEGVQLVQDATADGNAAEAERTCALFSCIGGSHSFMPPSTLAGTNTCGGVPGFVPPQPGGYGGSGGKYMRGSPALPFQAFPDATYAAQPGVNNRTSAAGTDGAPGTNAAALGTITREGYAPADGTNGSNGSKGDGGKGGSGLAPVAPADANDSTVWLGINGASGGAGGCPGLAGTAGKGGGASIAALLFDSALTLESTEVVSGRGGDAGLGAFGSEPTPGGEAGANATGRGEVYAWPGGRGGAAGISGNGGTGPSIGIAHAGPAPKIAGGTKMTAGAGGAEVAERSRTTLGVTVIIPATPAGLSKDILAL